jgi:hypothetical protein
VVVVSSRAVAALGIEAVWTTSAETSRERMRSQTATAKVTPSRTKNVGRNRPFFN